MTYVYDVTLNFNNIFYDFFEWNNTDYLYHIKKIPLIEVDKKIFNDLFLNNVKFIGKSLDMIKDKTEVYGKKDKRLTCALIKYNNNIFALKFEDNISVEISSILVEEELDILEVKTKINNNLEYKIINKRNNITTTRHEVKNKVFLKNQINNLNLIKDKEKIKYLYFEYFGNMIDNVKDALTKLKEEINKDNTESLKNFFIITSTKL